jgi:hypothetical protein
MQSLSVTVTRLPLHASADDPHVPIFTSANLATAKRTIIYFGEELQDLGVFAYRTVGQVSTAAGTALDFVSAIQASKDSPGIIIANLGQLIWYRRGKRAVTRVTWNALPGKTAVSGPMRVDPVKNRVPGNEDMAAHVKYIFDEVVPQMVNPDAKLDVIGVGEGAAESVSYLDGNWDQWEPRIQAIAVGTGPGWPGEEIRNPKFMLFFAKVYRFFFPLVASPHWAARSALPLLSPASILHTNHLHFHSVRVRICCPNIRLAARSRGGKTLGAIVMRRGRVSTASASCRKRTGRC